MLRLTKVHLGLGGSPPVEHLTVSLAELLGQFRGCFARPESFVVFQPVVVAWVLCLRCRTLTEVWQLTGLGRAQSQIVIMRLCVKVVDSL